VAGSLANVEAARVTAQVLDEESSAWLNRLGAAGAERLTGAFVNPDPVYLQSAGFVLDPGGNVVVSVYSSGAIGRLVPDDVVGLVRYRREHSAPATA